MRGRRSERASAVHPIATGTVGHRRMFPRTVADHGRTPCHPIHGPRLRRVFAEGDPYRSLGQHVPGTTVFARNTPPESPDAAGVGRFGGLGCAYTCPGVMTPGYGANRLRRMCANEWPLARDAGPRRSERVQRGASHRSRARLVIGACFREPWADYGRTPLAPNSRSASPTRFRRRRSVP